MSLEPEAARKPSTQSSSNPPKVRRRNRIITSCLECRRRKLKCDRLHPCNHCAKAARDCVFLSPALDSASKGKLNEFKESIDNLEKGLERHADGAGLLEWTVSSQSNRDYPGHGQSVLSSDQLRPREPVPEDEHNLEPSPLAVTDITYDDDGDDLLDDLGIKMGKMRITERIGGFVRPRFAEEVAETLRDKFNVTSTSPGLPFASPSVSSPGSTASYMQPGPDYISPGEDVLFQHAASDDISLISFLPSRDFADRLIIQYWHAVHLIARVVHRPSFERQYSQFWQEVAQGFEPSSTLQALVFAAMFSAAISLPAEISEAEFGCSREDMIRTFRAGCEHALSRSKLLRTTKVSTIQAFVMYLLAICRSEVSRAHASLVSMAIRLAECAGLHRDGTTFGLSPVEVHVRRLIWYQLCFLDIRTVEAVGPRPSIRKEDYDTKLPLHVDDIELESLVTPRQDAARFTDMTIARISFESFEIHRLIWIERPRIEKGQSSLTSLLRKVEEFREYSLQKFMPLLDKSVPQQLYAVKVLQLLLCKAFVNVLHRYVASVPQSMPERLLEIVWSSGTGVLENAVELDSSPALKPWAWYLGAYSQFHVALLLIYMIYVTPDRPEADRIWASLDYIFEFPEHLSRVDKVALGMSIAGQRLDEYQKHRKRRVPTSVDENLSVRKATSPPRRKESSESSPYKPLPLSSPNSESSYAVPSVSENSSSDPWLFPPSSRSATMGFAPVIGSIAQPQVLSAAKRSMSPNAFQFSSGPNLGQSGRAQSASATAAEFADLDWDELNRLFPQDAPMLSFDPAPPAEPSSTTSGIPAMTYFPDPWSRSRGNQG